MKTYIVYGYYHDDEEGSIVVKAESEEKAVEMAEDYFYYGITYVVEIKEVE